MNTENEKYDGEDVIYEKFLFLPRNHRSANMSKNRDYKHFDRYF